MEKQVKGTRIISDEAVRKATGKSWQDWFRILDKFDRKAKGHKLTAKYLYTDYGLSGWWSQMVTVRYEWEHGLRENESKA